MLSGASRAVAAVLVIDAVEGVAENSKRHGLLLSLLGISQVLVAVNKLDLVNYDRQIFENIKNEYEAYLETLKVKPLAFVPVSAREGKNITEPAPEMPWYTGKTVLEMLDSFHNLPSNEDSFFAMPVQDVYRFSNDNDDRRIYAGTVVSGEISVGDPVTFLPSHKEAHIRNIEVWSAPAKTRVVTGEASGFTLEEEIYVKRGEVMVKSAENALVEVTDKIRANVIWLGIRPLSFYKTYLLKLGAIRVDVRLEKIESFLGEGEQQYNELRRHDCGSVILSLAQPIAISTFYDNASLGRFVIVDGYDAAGGGIVLENLSTKKSWESLNSFEGIGGKDDFEEELFALLRKHFPHRF
jgi:bifunctional enzyme CysN/CysC/sulfate adenylyltransferase subunit 1